MILGQLRMGARQAKNAPLSVSVSYNFSLQIHLGHPQSLNNSIRCLSWDLTRVAKYWSESKSVPIKTFESASTLKPLENRKLPIFPVWNRYYETCPIIPGKFFFIKTERRKTHWFHCSSISGGFRKLDWRLVRYESDFAWCTYAPHDQSNSINIKRMRNF